VQCGAHDDARPAPQEFFANPSSRHQDFANLQSRVSGSKIFGTHSPSMLMPSASKPSHGLWDGWDFLSLRSISDAFAQTDPCRIAALQSPVGASRGCEARVLDQ
jgi:hypothetical protein